MGKGHARNEDIYLNKGGTNEVTAANAKDAVVKRHSKSYYNIGRPRVLNLTLTDTGLKGFRGGFTDGQYGYFVPFNDFSNGKLARVDLNDFSTVNFIDLTLIDRELNGFEGGFTDGQYGYLVPNDYDLNGNFSGKIARLQMFFGGN